MSKIITKYEEYHMMKYFMKKFSRDETVALLSKKMKELQFENGVLKSELSELQEQKGKTKLNLALLENKSLKQIVHELLYQMEACGCPIPKKYIPCTN